MRARALRPDADRAARVDTHERTAARSHRVQVDARQPDREAADLALGDARRAGAGKDAHVGRSAAHIQADRVLEPRAARDEPPATTPPAGPETRIRAGCAAASSTVTTPP